MKCAQWCSVLERLLVTLQVTGLATDTKALCPQITTKAYDSEAINIIRVISSPKIQILRN